MKSYAPQSAHNKMKAFSKLLEMLSKHNKQTKNTIVLLYQALTSLDNVVEEEEAEENKQIKREDLVSLISNGESRLTKHN